MLPGIGLHAEVLLSTLYLLPHYSTLAARHSSALGESGESYWEYMHA